MVAIPARIEDVTADWLAEATGLSITGVDHTQIGIGIGVSGAVYRSQLTGTDVPSTVVVKLPALAEEAVFTSTVLRMYIREVKFFDELAHKSPIRVPGCYFTAVDEETSQFVVVMEDMADVRVVDQTIGMDIADARRAVDELAAWHARFWGRSQALVDSGVAVSIGDPVYPAVLPTVFAEGWEKLTANADVPPEILEVGPRWIDAMPKLLGELASEPTTILHGDYRADNILFADDGSVVLLDFQLTGHGNASYDLAYFITQSLLVDTASEHERALFDRWVSALVDGGVPEAETAGLWEKYRTAALFCLTYPVVACRGMDLDDPRQMALINSMSGRFARAVRDLDLASLL